MSEYNATERSPAPASAQIITLVWIRGSLPEYDLGKFLLNLGAFAFENSPQGGMASFASPSLALKAAIDAVSVGPDQLRAGISTAEVMTEIARLRLVDEVQTLSLMAETGQIIVSLPFQELVRTSAAEDTRFLSLGTRNMSNSGGQISAFVVSNSRLPESPEISSPRRPYLGQRFLGRINEIAYLNELTDRGKLISLLGTSGVGKTALASRFASECLDDKFRDGSFWVDLTSVSRPFLLVHQIAKALDIPNYDESSVVSRVSSFLGEKDALLILDGTSGLEDAVASLCERLMRDCTNLVILTTGLRRLGIKGEEPFVVEGLELPLAMESVDAVRSYDSVQLFLKEASLVDPDFRLTAGNLNQVVAIVTILEGFPQALIMAASRLSVLTIEQLSSRLRDDPLSELRDPLSPDGSKGIELAFSMTLAGVSPWAQALYERLSIFEGPFDLEAAESVCFDEELPKGAIHPALRELCEMHLVRKWSKQSKVRAFFLPNLAKEFALRLSSASDSRKDLLAKKAAYVDARLLRVIEEVSTGKAEILDEFDLLYEDAFKRWKHLLTTKHAPQVGGEISKVAGYWFQRGYFSEGLEIIADVLASKDLEEWPEFGKMLVVGAWMAMRLGQLTLANKYARIAVRFSFEADNLKELVMALNIAGCLALDSNRPRTAYRLLRRASELGEFYCDKRTWRTIQLNYSLALSERGMWKAAEELMETLRKESTGSEWSDLTLLANVADLRLQQDDVQGCFELLRLASDQLTTTPDPSVLNVLYSTAAWAALKAGREADAITLLHAYSAIVEHFGLTLSPRRSRRRERLVQFLGCDPIGPVDWSPTSPTALMASLIAF